jgi:hypothetical protein
MADDEVERQPKKNSGYLQFPVELNAGKRKHRT